jgi:hypothetical protein
MILSLELKAHQPFVAVRRVPADRGVKKTANTAPPRGVIPRQGRRDWESMLESNERERHRLAFLNYDLRNDLNASDRSPIALVLQNLVGPAGASAKGAVTKR